SRPKSKQLKRITQRQRRGVRMEISRREHILRQYRQIFVISVVTPVSFSAPAFRKVIVESAVRPEPFRIERPRHRVRIEQNCPAVCPTKIAAEMRGQPVKWHPHQIEVPIV